MKKKQIWKQKLIIKSKSLILIYHLNNLGNFKYPIIFQIIEYLDINYILNI